MEKLIAYYKVKDVHRLYEIMFIEQKKDFSIKHLLWEMIKLVPYSKDRMIDMIYDAAEMQEENTELSQILEEIIMEYDDDSKSITKIK